MSRIADRFHQVNSSGRSLLIPFLMAGDPGPDWTLDLMHAAVAAGADLIEVGVPFSDPMADGPVIQKAHERALPFRLGLSGVLDLVARFRATDRTTPVVLMGYLNPVEAMGYGVFAERAARAGLDGAIVVDMPLEESGEFDKALRAAGLDQIFLLAPTTQLARVQAIADSARGFLYYVSLRGVTGAGHLDLGEASDRIGAFRSVTALPIGLGFGIDGPAAAKAAAGFADAVVVGSALVARIAAVAARPRAEGLAEVSTFIGSLRRAIEEGAPARVRASS